MDHEAGRADSAPGPPLGARVSAGVALGGFAVLVVALLVYLFTEPLAICTAAIGLGLGIPIAWLAATRHRFRVPLAILAAALVVGAFVALVVADEGRWYLVVIALAILVTIATGSLALRWEMRATVARRWTHVAPARHGVLLMNLKSGGGKAEKFGLAAEATRRGIEPVVLGEGDDLQALAEAAAQRGADVLGMAGGDGSQAIVAGVAAAHDLPFVCVPAGTRNHLALDLGVDRKDVVGSLDAFGHGLQTRMDLAEVNGRVFVNNVSLGVYASVVASDAYRDAKLQTAAKMLPDLLGPDAPPSDLHIQLPGGGAVDDPQVVMVSNGPYRLDRLAGFGTHARLDLGVLGVAALHLETPAATAKFIAAEVAGRVDQFAGWQSWDRPSVEITSGGAVEAGVDGESVTLTPPLRFSSRPSALAVRIAPHHPGVSPAARRPGFGRSTFLGLARVVSGRTSGLIAGAPSPPPRRPPPPR